LACASHAADETPHSVATRSLAARAPHGHACEITAPPANPEQNLVSIGRPKMSDAKKDRMTAFWSERATLYGDDARANTSDIWLRDIEIGYVDRIIQKHEFHTVLDFGCANGYSTFKLAELHPGIRFVGIDINEAMIAAAQTRCRKEARENVEFSLHDVQSGKTGERFDFIYAIRVFQNMENQEKQKSVFNTLLELLVAGGMLLCVESYMEGYARLNADRTAMGLPPLPVHEHLTLLTDDFDLFASGKMQLVSKEYLSSSYYLVTRLLYSYIAKMNNEPIDYNHPIHQVGTLIPQIGDYGPQRACLYRKS
jgi:ubiquinone/menaquinone biosynthesis C-methylase UbiE